MSYLRFGTAQLSVWLITDYNQYYVWFEINILTFHTHSCIHNGRDKINEVKRKYNKTNYTYIKQGTHIHT